MHPRVGVLSSSVYPPIAVLDQLHAVNITQVRQHELPACTTGACYFCCFALSPQSFVSLLIKRIVFVSLQPAPGVWVYDFGQEIAGFCTLTVSGPAGTKGRYLL